MGEHACCKASCCKSNFCKITVNGIRQRKDDIMAMILIAIMTVFCMLICHAVAERRGARPAFWGVMGAVFGPFAIPFVFMAKPRAPK